MTVLREAAEIDRVSSKSEMTTSFTIGIERVSAQQTYSPLKHFHLLPERKSSFPLRLEFDDRDHSVIEVVREI